MSDFEALCEMFLKAGINYVVGYKGDAYKHPSPSCTIISPQWCSTPNFFHTPNYEKWIALGEFEDYYGTCNLVFDKEGNLIDDYEWNEG